MAEEQKDKQEQKGQEVKMCPFIYEPCSKEECAIYMKIQAPDGRVIGTCALIAIGIMISQKQQRVNLPQGLQGMQGLQRPRG